MYTTLVSSPDRGQQQPHGTDSTAIMSKQTDPFADTATSMADSGEIFVVTILSKRGYLPALKKNAMTKCLSPVTVQLSYPLLQ